MADPTSRKARQLRTARSLTHTEGYLQQAREPVHSLMIIVPLLLIFHVGASQIGSNLAAPRMIGAFLRFFGATADFLPPLFVVLVLTLQQLARKSPWRVRPKVLAGIVGESILWTIPLIGISQLTGRLTASPAAMEWLGSSHTFHLVVAAIGAGVYEEFLFRLALISLVVLVLADIFELNRRYVTPGAIVGGALLFSLCHFTPEQWRSLSDADWPKSVFLCVAGVLWGCLYVYRGFGIAAGAHVVWDLYVGFSTS